MKVVVLGAAGIQAQGVILDLCMSNEISEVVLADLEKTKSVLESRAQELGSGKATVATVDVTDHENLVTVLKGCSVCANCIVYTFNLQIMEACAEVGCHYTDMGGLFHVFRKQVGLHEQWRAKGLTAALSMGSAPGITNVLASFAAKRLDTIESIHLRDGIVNYAKSDFPLTVPYAMQTLLQEFNDNCLIFQDGDWKEVSPFSQEEVIDFPAPVGNMNVYATIHSEVASIPVSFKDKGILHASFKLGLPKDFEQKMRFLAGLGFGSTQTIDVKGKQVSPRDFFVAFSETFPKPSGKPQDHKCLRVDAKGVQDGIPTEIQADVMCHPPTFCDMKTGPYSVGVPLGIVCRMLIKGEISERGCMPAEQYAPPEIFLNYLAEREMHSTFKIRQPIA